jgi:hypothetical protein
MSSALRKLRIIAIPLSGPNVSRTLTHPYGKPSRLVYYQFQSAIPLLKSPPSIRLASGDQDSDLTNAKKKGLLLEEGVAKWVNNKASDMWAWFGMVKNSWNVCSVY